MYMRHKYSASEAKKQMSSKKHSELFHVIKRKSLIEGGLATKAQLEVGQYLRRMGVDLTVSGIICGGLYRADIVLLNKKAFRYIACIFYGLSI